jgi:hypothetical protein
VGEKIVVTMSRQLSASQTIVLLPLILVEVSLRCFELRIFASV